jgi:predicted DNA-binding WGR domain protein
VSEWKVNLEFEEGGSSKFWRARVDGGTLYVNFGRIGTGGQTQVKELGPEGAEKELAKLEREKRKKGYTDAGGGGGGDEEEAEEAEEEEEEEEKPKKAAVKAAPAPAAKPAPAKSAGAVEVGFALYARGRKADATLVLDGNTVRMEAVEKYQTADAAKAAFDRLRAQLENDGYVEK